MSGTNTGIKALKGHGEGHQRHGRCKERDILKLRMGEGKEQEAAKLTPGVRRDGSWEEAMGLSARR